MNKWLFGGFLLACLAAVLPGGAMAEAGNSQAARTVAVTFDDLPFVLEFQPDDASIDAWTRQLVGQIAADHVPAVGFVNESKLYKDGQLDQARVDVLKAWLDAGAELGNHTFSHASLNRSPLDVFEQDVIRGETVTRQLLEERGQHLKYFRYPFLQVGLTLEKRRSFEQFLGVRGYTIAPVTLSSGEWIFAAAYTRAWRNQNAALMQRVADAYIPYMEETVKQGEKLSVDLFGYVVPQVLVLHANALNADHFSEVVAMLKKRGYTFVTLAQAMQSPAYRSADVYAGPNGFTDLDRWARTVGLRPPPDPVVPAFVMRAAGRVAYTGY